MSASVDNLAERDGSSRLPGSAVRFGSSVTLSCSSSCPSPSRCSASFVGYVNSWPIGFDFRGTLWEPARALLDGAADLPGADARQHRPRQPGRLPARLHPRVRAARAPPRRRRRRGSGSACSAPACFASLWILGVRDWRCLVLALTSPVVVHGLYYGNLTVLLRPARRARVALPRSCAGSPGSRSGAAVAAKLFVWPLVVWLLLTRRFRAAAWAIGSAVVLVSRRLGADRVRGLPRLSEAAARRAGRVCGAEPLALDRRRRARRLGRPSPSRSPRSPASPASASRRWLVARTDGDRRAFAVRRRRVHARVADRLAELRGAPLRPDRDHVAAARAGLVLRVRDLARSARSSPKRPSRTSCCRPRGVPEQAWAGATRSPCSGTRQRMSAVVVAVGIGFGAYPASA